MDMSIHDTILQKNYELISMNIKPEFVIVDYHTYMELRQDRDRFWPSHHTRDADGDRYIGLRLSVLLHTQEDLTIIEVK